MLRQEGKLPREPDVDQNTQEVMMIQSGLDLTPQQLEPGQTGGGGYRVPPSGPANPDGHIDGRHREPFENQQRLPGMVLLSDQGYYFTGIRSTEFNIEGNTFHLYPNATPGAELMLTCAAQNSLPHDTSFLGMPPTMAHSRFVVAGESGRERLTLVGAVVESHCSFSFLLVWGCCSGADVTHLGIYSIFYWSVCVC